MNLREIREMRGLTQLEVATVLGIGQPSVSKMERKTDMKVETLYKYMSALGGELKLEANFPIDLGEII